MDTFESFQDAKEFVWGLGIHDANEFQVCGDLWYFETAADAQVVRDDLELARARAIDIRPIPTDVGLSMVWFRAPATSQDAEPVVTAFPISDDGTVSVSAKAYHDLERRIADLEAQAIKDARTIEGLSAQIVHAQMELAEALGHEEADYHANLPDLAYEVTQLRQQLAEARAALEIIAGSVNMPVYCTTNGIEPSGNPAITMRRIAAHALAGEQGDA